MKMDYMYQAKFKDEAISESYERIERHMSSSKTIKGRQQQKAYLQR